MLIVPISNIGFDSLSKIQSAQTDNSGSLPFQSFFEDAITNVQETQKAVDEEAIKLATGQSDDTHNLNIASAKASLALDLLVQIRNKTLDSYNEMMRMNI